MEEQQTQSATQAREWHALSPEEALAAANATAAGLTSEEAKRRLAENGPNALKAQKKKSIWRMIFEQIWDVMILILLGAAVISLIFEEWPEAVVIFVITARSRSFPPPTSSWATSCFWRMGASFPRISAS